MKSVRWILIGSRIFALTCGLTVVGSGCGDTSTATPGTVSREEAKRNDESKKAMEEAAKAKK